MYQKDYILRMLEIIGELVARIIGLILKKDLQQASVLLESAYRDFLKEDASYFQKLPKEQLTNKLLVEHDYTNDHLRILAELFYAEAKLSAAKKNETSSFEYYEKSLLLFEFLEEHSTSYSLEVIQKISEIKMHLAL